MHRSLGHHVHIIAVGAGCRGEPDCACTTYQELPPAHLWALWRHLKACSLDTDSAPDVVQATSPAHLLVARMLFPSAVRVYLTPVLSASGCLVPWLLRSRLAHGVVAWHNRTDQARLPAGVQINVFPPAVAVFADDAGTKQPTREQLGLSDTQFVIFCPLSTGRRREWRGALWALGILEFVVPRVALIVTGSEDWQDSVYAFARKARLSSEVVWAPAAKTAAELATASDLVWSLHDRTSLPLGVWAAAATGRPVVCHPLTGTALESRASDIAACVPPWDAPALARTTEALSRDPDTRQRFGNALQALARGLYNPLSVAQRWLDWYERLAESVTRRTTTLPASPA
ncbi:MAG: hypothetical protein C4297_13890 [Gemmataceae bacterium]